MALLKIARMGHPVLTHLAEPVADPTDPAIRRLVQDMLETMLDADGVGLAAPQVHVPLRLFVFHLPAERAEAAVPPTALINPRFTPIGEDIETGWEGCLSIPGLRARVPRHARLCYEGTDQEGQPVTGEAEGLLARIIQHEYDHLDGVMYPSRITDFATFGFTDELARTPRA